MVFRGTASLLDVLMDWDLVQEREGSWGKMHRGFATAYSGRGRAKGIQNELFDALSRHGYDVNLWKSTEFGNSNASALDSSPREKPTKELWITGHSAGGALAQVMAADLTEREVEFRGLWGAQRCESLKAPTQYVTGVVTFGSPRLGDQAFAQCFDTALKGRHWRFVNNQDIVAQLPWIEFGYRHAGENLYLFDDGKLHVNPGVRLLAQDMSRAIFGRFVKGDFSAVGQGIHDHVLYPQPLAHQYDARCSHQRGAPP